MKKSHVFIVLGVLLLLFPPTSGASDQLNVSEETPAILASLNQSDVTPLDDSAIAEIRGQSQYVMGKILGLNTWDFSLNWQVKWVVGIQNIAMGWRYGNWGGPFYTDNGPPVDRLDDLFRQHDEGALDNTLLSIKLGSLPNTFSSSWGGFIYDKNSYNEPWGPDPFHWFYSVYVSKISVINNPYLSFRCFWQNMPLTEYARRQAFIAVPYFPAVP